MAYVPYSFPLTGGLDRRVSSFRADKGGFYTLQNLRQCNTARGQLEQTPRFYSRGQLSQGTYWASGSQTEPTSSAVRFWDDTIGLRVTDFCLWGLTGQQLKVLARVSQPADDGVTKGCLLDVVSASSMSVTLGSTYDVEIDGTDTFKWRVNAGAWTTGVTINQTDGNLIDSGNIRLYWLASTGFTVTDTWSWRRTDYSDLAAFGTSPVQFLQINADIYYMSGTQTLYVIKNGVYARTAGYRTVLGTGLALYENHLFSFSHDTIYNSDINNIEVFTPTDVNEADEYDPVLSRFPGPSYAPRFHGGTVFQNRLYIFADDGMWYTDYAGLPVPFSIKKLTPLNSTGYNNSYIVTTRQGIFVSTAESLYSFDGANFALVLDYSTFTSGNAIGLLFIDNTGELLIHFGSFFLVYQTQYQLFYTRATDVSTSGITGWNVNIFGNLNLGTSDRTMLGEDVDFALAPVFDSSSGTTYATPMLVTHILGEMLSVVKDSAPVFVGFSPQANSVANYSTQGNLAVKVRYGLSDTGVPASSWVDFGQATSQTNPLICGTRFAFRGVQFEVSLVGLVTNRPPGSCTIYALETLVRPADER